MVMLVVGLIVFLGLHSIQVFMPGYRASFIEKHGALAWRGVYSVLSLVGLVLLIYGFGVARVSGDNVHFYVPPDWATHLQMLLMLMVMILLVASQFPMSHIKKRVKNPMLVGTKIWAIGHLLVNGDLASWLLFGTFLSWAVLLVINTKRREQHPQAEPQVKYDIIAVIGGIVVWVLFVIWLHTWLIGVPVIA